MQLRVEQAIALTQSSALHGLGGVGKTQVALEYAYRHALEYNAVFWIEAETADHIISSLLHIAEVLQLPERDDKDQQRIVVAVQRWLTMHSRWLLIWDNAEDLTLFDRFLPPVRQGAILLTTRAQALGILARGVSLSPMESEDAMLFLLRRAKVLDPTATQEQLCQLAASLPGEYAAAKKLVEVLGGLPLALDQAGAYIEETGCRFADYLQSYGKQRTRLLARRGTPGDNHPHSVVATFRLIWQRVRQGHPAAADLLCVCAYLHAEAIPEELFLVDLARPTASEPDSSDFDLALAALRTCSLVQRHLEACTFSLHRLVQVVLQEEMSEPSKYTYFGIHEEFADKALNIVLM